MTLHLNMVCDSCPHVQPFRFVQPWETIADVMESFRKLGWSLAGPAANPEVSRCPECVRQNRGR